MDNTTGKLNNDQYTVGWISALPLEMAAAQGMLDEEHGDSQSQDPHDHNTYSLGRMGNQNVVIACLPAGTTGTTSAATVAAQMLRSFTSIKFGLMVGIGGGVPTRNDDIRLGDVVVSQPKDCFGGVVQYGKGKRTLEGKFQRTGMLSKPPPVLLSALATIRAKYIRQDPELGRFLDDTFRNQPKMLDSFSRPEQRDDLYRGDYEHQAHDGDSPGCFNCDRSRVVKRPNRRSPTEPLIFYGTIASGEEVVKHASSRDKLSEDLGGILCFETEAAGLMDGFPCLVIRGISNYADSHKNEGWQYYAAATAAAFAKKLLTFINRKELEKTVAAKQITSHSDPSRPDQFWPTPEHPFIQQRASLSPQLWPALEQPSALQRGSPSPQLLPGLGRPGVQSSPLINQLAGQVAPSNPPQPPPVLNRSGDGGLVLTGPEGNGRKAIGIRRKNVGAMPGEIGGYRQPVTMDYPQVPAMSSSHLSRQTIHHHHSSPIPLRPLFGQQRDLRQPSAPDVIHPTRSYVDVRVAAGPTTMGASGSVGEAFNGKFHDGGLKPHHNNAGAKQRFNKGDNVTDKPKHDKPKHDKPKHGKPKHGKSKDDNPKHGKSKDGKPKHGKSKDGKPKHGKSLKIEGNSAAPSTNYIFLESAGEAGEDDRLNASPNDEIDSSDSESDSGLSASDYDSEVQETDTEDEVDQTRDKWRK